ncbi:hypothetical protein D3C75_749310 [compost metagenome]
MGFNLREVEHIVDDGLQQMGRVGGVAEQGLLRGLEPAMLQQIQHPQHRIHGGADLVGHHGQELGLGAVGTLGLIPRPRQLLLAADLAANLPRRAPITDEGAAGVMAGLGIDLHPAGAARQRHLGAHRPHRQMARNLVLILAPGGILLVVGKVIEAAPRLADKRLPLIAGGRDIAQPVLGIRLPEPVRRHGGKAAKALLACLKRQGLEVDLLLQARPIGNVDQRLGDERATTLHRRLALEIEGARGTVPADEHPGEARRLQARHHYAGPARRPRQGGQLGQLGRIIDDQGFTCDGAGEERRQRPGAADLPGLGAQMGGAARALPGDHISLFEADEGLERQNEAVQHLLQALGLCQRRHAAQQSL